MMLIEQGHKPAVWMSELDMESNSGAHMNSSYFVTPEGSYKDLSDNGKQQFSGKKDLMLGTADVNK